MDRGEFRAARRSAGSPRCRRAPACGCPSASRPACAARRCARPAAPSAASPTTSMSSSASSSAANPARTSSWSSASATRIMARSQSYRQPRPDPETAFRPGPGLQRAAEGLRAFGHAGDAVARPVRPDRARGGRAMPSSSHLDDQGAIAIGDAHRGLDPSGMPGAVGQGLLDDPVRGEVHVGRQRLPAAPASSTCTASPAAAARPPGRRDGPGPGWAPAVRSRRPPAARPAPSGARPAPACSRR